MKTLIFPSADAIHRRGAEDDPDPSIPDERPSERPTRPTLPPPEDPSDQDMVLSERDFIDDSAANASTMRPPPDKRRAPSWLLPALRIAAAAVFLVVAISALLDAPTVIVVRDPRIAWPDRTTLGEPAVAPAALPPAHGCVAIAPPRFVAPRAIINPGLDVSETSTGFVVALASSSDEGTAVRLEGTTLRAAESIRVRAHAAVRRVVARDDDQDGVDVRVDSDDARSVLPPGDGPAYRIGLAGTFVVARVGDRVHSLWSLPLPPKDRRIDALRVAPRDDGGAVVVIKRGSTLYLGLVNGSLSATGPFVSVTRPAATIGTPFVVANGAGAALAWAERANGARDWSIVVASYGGGEMETRTIAPGISPSLGVLPDGTLVVAHADGPAASHRVVVRRLSADLAPLGDPVIASTEGTNAGQPVIDVRADGRALVAWLAVSRGQPAVVYATPLECDTSP